MVTLLRLTPKKGGETHPFFFINNFNMTEKDICLDFIKHFYYVTVIKSVGDDIIVFHDCCETSNTNKLHYLGTVFGFDLFLTWDKAEKLTNINIQKKDNDSIVNFAKMLKHSQTFSFIKYLIESVNKRDNKIQLPLNEVKEEFPLLYDNESVENNFIHDFSESIV